VQMINKNILILYHQLIQNLKLNSYFKKQRYQIDYKVTITNNGKTSERLHCVFPIPQSTPYQIITSNKFTQKGEISTDQLYKNKFYVVELNLKPQQVKIVTHYFKATILPNVSRGNIIIQEKPTPNNQFISTNTAIKKIVSQLIIKDQKKDAYIKAVYDYVITKLSYGNPIDGLYSVNETLVKPSVDCGGFVVLFCSLMSALNISCLPVFGYYLGYNQNNMHAWAKMPSGDVFDPTSEYLFNKARSFKSGGFGWIGSDHLELSSGCDFDIDVNGQNKRVDILQKALLFPKNNNVLCMTELLSDKKNV